MSLSGLETALAEFVGDSIVNDCDQPPPDRVLRYHGTLPNDCCTENGTLAVSWAMEYLSADFPNSTAANRDPCPGVPVATINLRYVICWPPLRIVPGKLILADDSWDARAARLADVADGVTRAFARLMCAPDLADPIVAAVVQAAGRNRVRFIDVAPLPVLGLCAGVLWRVYASPATGPEPVS